MQDLRFSLWWRCMSWSSGWPWRWRQQSPPKCWYSTTSLHDLTTQKNTTYHTFLNWLQQ